MPQYFSKNPRPRIRQLLLAATITAGILSMGGYAQANMETHHTTMETDKMSLPTQKFQTINFKKDKVYEIVYFTVKPGKQKQLDEEYFPVSMPIVAEYGGKMNAMFVVTDIVKGDLEGHMVGIFEWPSLDIKNKMHEDPRFKKVAPIMQDAMSYFKTGFYEIENDTDITFSNRKSYEFFGAWIKSDEILKEYFKVTGPIKKNYGRSEPKFKLALKPAKGQGFFAYAPDMSGIVEWDKGEDYYALTNSKEFKAQAEGLLNDSIKEMNLVQTKILIQ